MEKQKSLKNSVVFEGVGLHTGKNTKIEILPALPEAGIFFVRQDIENSPFIKAQVDSVLSPAKFPRRTSLGVGLIHVYTIEHLMAAFNILGIDNAQVNVWGEEIPGMDGSAKAFVDKIRQAGIDEQESARNYLVIKEPVWLDEGESSIVILPYNGTRISYVIKYDNPVIGSGFVDVELNSEMADDFYEARTFCLEDEVKPLQEQGLGKGSNYENTLVISETGVIKNQLRFSDEFVKHKMLDLVGDLYLIGPIKGHVLAVKSGHPLNLQLINKLRRLRDERRSNEASLKPIVSSDGALDVQEIMKILPHRYPFLLVDRIISLDKGKEAVGIKNITANEGFFAGHFPGRPVMPGVLMIEAMAQVGGIAMLACDQYRGKLAYFMTADKVKFRNTVTPGDQLLIKAQILKTRGKTGLVSANVVVDGKVAVEAELMFALVD